MNIVAFKTDKIGILASALCMIHCIATPFIFIAKSCSASCCEASPTWWRLLDYIFLIVSFFAVYQSTKNTTKTWIKYAMWCTWATLLIVLLNEVYPIVSIFENAIYLPAITLVALHLYNLRFCQCEKDNCCIN